MTKTDRLKNAVEHCEARARECQEELRKAQSNAKVAEWVMSVALRELQGHLEAENKFWHDTAEP